MSYSKFLLSAMFIIGLYVVPINVSADVAEPDSEAPIDSEITNDTDEPVDGESDPSDAYDNSDDDNGSDADCSFAMVNSHTSSSFFAVAAMLGLGLWLGRRSR